MMKLAVLIPAAGSSARYSAAMRAEQGVDMDRRSKLDEDLGGRCVLHRTVELFTQGSPAVSDVVALVVVAGPHEAEAFEAFKLRHGDKLALSGVKICRGGETHRYETVAAALAMVPTDQGFTHVAVHDAARPCTPEALLERLIEAAEQFPAVVPGVPVADTLKRLGADVAPTKEDPLAAILGDAGSKRSARAVLETVDRREVVGVQTPQIFEIGLLRRAYAQKDLTSTDDAQLVERLGERVVVVDGDQRNLKITTPTDLVIARAILGVGGGSGKPTHLRF